ncbi:hypothetical protein EON66_05335 [archaeon]|nr:MAG: hypothetical protein EON66_05335 [archaeon]
MTNETLDAEVGAVNRRLVHWLHFYRRTERAAAGTPHFAVGKRTTPVTKRPPLQAAAGNRLHSVRTRATDVRSSVRGNDTHRPELRRSCSLV